MNDSPAKGFLLATAARIAGFPAESQWPAMLTLPQLAALLAGGSTGDQRAPFRDWCTVLKLDAKSGALQTTLSQREAIPAVRRVGSIGRAPREFVPPPAPGFRAVPAVTREAAAAWAQRQGQALPLTVAAWLASASKSHHLLETDEDSATTTGPAWVDALVASWPQLLKHYGVRPACLDVMRWLRHHGPRDVFPADQPDWQNNDPHVMWTDRDDTAGKRHKLRRTNLGNRISELVKAGRLPV